MSKQVPEVGDVWINKYGIKMVFICVNDYYGEYIEHCEKLAEGFDIYRVKAGYNAWKNGRKYLGKSKANIYELFEVQDDKKPNKRREAKDADSAAEAEEIAKEDVSKFDWEFDDIEDVDDISVESVEECNSDD